MKGRESVKYNLTSIVLVYGTREPVLDRNDSLENLNTYHKCSKTVQIKTTSFTPKVMTDADTDFNALDLNAFFFFLGLSCREIVGFFLWLKHLGFSCPCLQTPLLHWPAN